MPYAIDKEGILLQNLQDAGCDEKLIQDILSLQKTGDRQKQLYLLAQHKQSLLRQLHIRQKQIDCLDYLTYIMRREQQMTGV